MNSIPSSCSVFADTLTVVDDFLVSKVEIVGECGFKELIGRKLVFFELVDDFLVEFFSY